MNIRDFIKNSVLESGAFTQYNLAETAVALSAALLLGCLIYLVYRKFYQGVIYSRSFAVTLVGMTVLTCMVTLAISTNIVISLGMVGALSIVRYRTAIKDPLDTAFIFWAVGEGIAVGTKFYDVAIIAGIIIGIFVLLISGSRGKGGAQSYLLIIHYSEAAADAIRKMTKQLPGARLKSKVVRPGSIELTMELRLKENETGFVEKFLRVEGVYDASLITHQGDIVA